MPISKEIIDEVATVRIRRNLKMLDEDLQREFQNLCEEYSVAYSFVIKFLEILKRYEAQKGWLEDELKHL